MMTAYDDWSRPAYSGVVTFHDTVTNLEPVEGGVEVTLADGSVFFHKLGDNDATLISAPHGIN